MKILLYNPDNGVTQNFMPHLWMFLLQSLTPAGSRGAADRRQYPADERRRTGGSVCARQEIGLVGIGAMTRMIAKAYRVADALRAAGVPVVMGGPHVTEVPDEALGRDGGPRHADAIALGEADETWPRIVEDAARGQSERSLRAGGRLRAGAQAGACSTIPEIPWESIDIDQFNRIPGPVARASCSTSDMHWETFHIIPIESGRGCPYGCEFCTVTGFFGDSIRFRSNESIVDEMLRLKARARAHARQDRRILRGRQFRHQREAHQVAAARHHRRGRATLLGGQISANLLRDQELVDLIAESGGKWIFIGMESLDPANLASVNKSFNKPGEYAAVLERLARRQRLRHHVVHLRPGQRYGRRGRAHAGRDARTGRRCCRSSGRSRPSRRLRCTTAWRRKDG